MKGTVMIDVESGRTGRPNRTSVTSSTANRDTTSYEEAFLEFSSLSYALLLQWMYK